MSSYPTSNVGKQFVGSTRMLSEVFFSEALLEQTFVFCLTCPKVKCVSKVPIPEISVNLSRTNVSYFLNE